MDKCRHILTRGNKTIGQVVTDMIHIGGSPVLVFEWIILESGPEIPAPGATVALDPHHLRRRKFEAANYHYNLPVADPRKMT